MQPLGTASQRGMDAFRQGYVQASLNAFDAALAADQDIRPYLWQRGLSLYYLER